MCCDWSAYTSSNCVGKLLHFKFKKVVLTRSHFKTIIRSVIFTPAMCSFDFNSRFDSNVRSKWQFDAKKESK